MEVHTDIRFAPKSQEEARAYYHVLLHGHSLVSISAVVATTQNEAQVKQVQEASLPSDIKRTLRAKNSTGELTIYKV